MIPSAALTSSFAGMLTTLDGNRLPGISTFAAHLDGDFDTGGRPAATSAAHHSSGDER